MQERKLDAMTTHARKLERERDEAIRLLKLCADHTITTYQEEAEEFKKNKMSDEEINIAIAEACGIKTLRWQGKVLYEVSHKLWDINVPDYCNDLNAMHEAENVLVSQCKEHDYWFFVRQLMGFPDAECDWDEVLHFNAIHATARQRAEAFLKTIGKWEDGAK